MADSSSRLIVLSLDGLSTDDFVSLLPLLPRSRHILESASMSLLDAGALQQPAAIWAEILTGQPWYRTGCAGYARPVGSVNNLSIVSEKDLLYPTVLTTSERAQPDVCINIPLLLPNPGHRTWLSDGSQSTNLVISPRKLAKNSPFAEYLSRPYPDYATAFGLVRRNIEASLSVESIRLSCAMELFRQTEWATFFWRLTMFDQLAHLVGLEYLAMSDLWFSAQLSEFLDRFDTALLEVLQANNVTWLLLSAFSHTACQGTINLNSLLAKAGFLHLEPALTAPHRIKSEREMAVAAISGRKLTNSALTSFDGRIDAACTAAASPIYGTIFINRVGRFADGAVDKAEYETTYARVREYLRNALCDRFNRAVTLEENPCRTSTDNTAPDFLVYVEGVEFHNMQDYAAVDCIPKSTHRGAGFVVTPRSTIAPAAGSLKPNEIANLISCARTTALEGSSNT